MAGPSRLEKIQFIITVAGISGATAQCTSTNILASIDHKACQPFEYRKITANKPEFCTLACVQINYCGATIYDKMSGDCMLMNQPCFSLTTYPDHVYQSFLPVCTKWVPHDESHPTYWYMEDNTHRSYVSRKTHAGNILLGKYTVDFFVIDPVNQAVINGGNYERVVVEPSCSVAWVIHDTTRGQPLPDGAFIGGILTTTNTPLYVARLMHSGKLLGGFYNPLNGKV